jgi:hypothetical protein
MVFRFSFSRFKDGSVKNAIIPICRYYSQCHCSIALPRGAIVGRTEGEHPSRATSSANSQAPPCHVAPRGSLTPLPGGGPLLFFLRLPRRWGSGRQEGPIARSRTPRNALRTLAGALRGIGSRSCRRALFSGRKRTILLAEANKFSGIRVQLPALLRLQLNDEIRYCGVVSPPPGDQKVPDGIVPKEQPRWRTNGSKREPWLSPWW